MSFSSQGRSRRSRARRRRWLAEAIFLIVGFVCLGWVSYSYLESYIYQSYEDYTLNEQMRGHRGSVIGFMHHLIFPHKPSSTTPTQEEPSQQNGEQQPETQANGTEPAQPPTAGPKPRLMPRDLIGRVEIPRLSISAIVREGVDARTLKHAVGHVPSTAMPGQPGNVAIAAHRDTFFRNLRGVKRGDRIQLVTPDATFDYEVESTKIVFPNNVEVLNPTPEPALTLVTCYPFNYIGSAPKRFIVRARQVETQANAKTMATGS